jgi:hypothetical protein
VAFIDGAKAPTAAVKVVLEPPGMARCRVHNIRNVEAKLPDALAATVATDHARRPTTIPTPSTRKPLSKHWPGTSSAPIPAPTPPCAKASPRR